MIRRGYCDSVAFRRDTVRPTAPGCARNTIPDPAGLASNGPANYRKLHRCNYGGKHGL